MRKRRGRATFVADDTQGRPLRVRNNDYIQNWEANRQAEIKQLTESGHIPVEHDIESMGDDVSDDVLDKSVSPPPLKCSPADNRLQRTTLPHGQGSGRGQREEERQGHCR